MTDVNLSENALLELVEALKKKDLNFAERLQELQDRYFPKSLKGIMEWAEAEKQKRIILGLAGEKKEISHTGNVVVNVVDYSQKVEENIKK